MKCIVPLAGPDLYTETYGLRPLLDVDGRIMIERALNDRAWAHQLKADDYVFVLREVLDLEILVRYLDTSWPGCRIIVLSHMTKGALFSVLSALSMIEPDEAIIVDLADILFESGPVDPLDLINEGYDAIVPVFSSDESCYSYLRMMNGDVVEAREKVVISDKASAGVYIFKNIQIFLGAAAHSIDHRDQLSYKNALFICPMVNGVIANGGRVAAPDIDDCIPVGKMFHGKS